MFDWVLDAAERTLEKISKKIERKGRAIARRGDALFGVEEYEGASKTDRTAGFFGFHDDTYKQKNEKMRRGLEAGDILKVSRGAYDHYGVYVGNRRVIHYTAETSDVADGTIQETGFKRFLRNADKFDMLVFPECHGKPASVPSPTSLMPNIPRGSNWAKELQYHLYTAKETVSRARSRLGENSYSLLSNNCEHFAIWCKNWYQRISPGKRHSSSAYDGFTVLGRSETAHTTQAVTVYHHWTLWHTFHYATSLPSLKNREDRLIVVARHSLVS